MKALPDLLLLLAIAALWVKSAQSLECYVCNDTKYTGCPTTENCSETDRFCTRYTSTSKIGFVLEQGCANDCRINKGAWSEEYTFSCCQEDRCNTARDVRSSTALLAAAIFTYFLRAWTDLEL